MLTQKLIHKMVKKTDQISAYALTDLLQEQDNAYGSALWRAIGDQLGDPEFARVWNKHNNWDTLTTKVELQSQKLGLSSTDWLLVNRVCWKRQPREGKGVPKTRVIINLPPLKLGEPKQLTQVDKEPENKRKFVLHFDDFRCNPEFIGFLLRKFPLAKLYGYLNYSISTKGAMSKLIWLWEGDEVVAVSTCCPK